MQKNSGNLILTPAGCFIGIAAAIAAWIETFYTGVLFDFYDWPFFNGWSILHGTVILIYPVYFGFSFWLIHLAIRKIKAKKLP